jgi:hypothetical protein
VKQTHSNHLHRFKNKREAGCLVKETTPSVAQWLIWQNTLRVAFYVRLPTIYSLMASRKKLENSYCFFLCFTNHSFSASFYFFPSVCRLTPFLLSLFVSLSSSMLLLYSLLFSFRSFLAFFLPLFPVMPVAMKGLRNKDREELEKRKALDRSKYDLTPLCSEDYLQDVFVVRQERSTSIHPQLPATRERIR